MVFRRLLRIRPLLCCWPCHSNAAYKSFASAPEYYQAPPSRGSVQVHVQQAVTSFLEDNAREVLAFTPTSSDERQAYRMLASESGCGFRRVSRTVYEVYKLFASPDQVIEAKRRPLADKVHQIETILEKILRGTGGSCQRWAAIQKAPEAAALQKLLGSPNRIARSVLDQGLDAQFSAVECDRRSVWLPGCNPNEMECLEVDCRQLQSAIEQLRGLERCSAAPNDFEARHPFGAYQMVDADACTEYYRQQRDHPLFRERMAARTKLPVWSWREKICNAVRANQCVVIVGATGCGKTTQVPQFLLDELMSSSAEPSRILCSQPRRISAVAAAERVAYERGELGAGKQVGYHVRFAEAVANNTQIVFSTVGVVLRRIQADPHLLGVTHIIVDEVHERDSNTDFLLYVLCRLMKQRPDLRVILMSASIDPTLFVRYMSTSAKSVEVVEIPGSTRHPIKELFLEDVLTKLSSDRYLWEEASASWSNARKRHQKSWFECCEAEPPSFSSLARLNVPDKIQQALSCFHAAPVEYMSADFVVAVCLYIHNHCPPGAILVFVPGWGEISEVVKRLRHSQSGSQLQLYPLHSLVPIEMQRAVFRVPPPGIRKIIVATSIAETSITVEDVVYVVDVGTIRQTQFDEATGIGSLVTVPASKSNALQRTGRAGRCAPGEVWRLYSTMQASATPNTQVAELVRMPVEEVALAARALRISGPLHSILGSLIEGPSTFAIESAVKNLQRLGAIDAKENLTMVGERVAALPIHPVLSKMILFAALFGCLDDIITIAAVLGHKSPFLSVADEESNGNAARVSAARDLLSDHLMHLRVFKHWSLLTPQQQTQFCRSHALSQQSLEYISNLRKDLLAVVNDYGIADEIDNGQLVSVASNAGQAVAAMAAALTPFKVKHGCGGQRAKPVLSCNLPADFHPTTLLSLQRRTSPLIHNVKWCVGYRVQRTSRVWVYDASPVPLLALLLLAGEVDRTDDTTIYISSSAMHAVQVKDKETGDLLMSLRSLLHSIVFPALGRPLHERERESVRIFLSLLECQDKDPSRSAQNSQCEDECDL